MRILNVNSYFSTSPFYRNLFDAQARLHDDARVYVPVGRGYPSGNAAFGPDTDEARVLNKWDRLFFHYRYGRVIADARARYDGQTFDLIHAHSLFSNGFVARALAQKMNRPYIVAVRDSDVNVFFKYMPHLRALGRRILRDAARVVFISSSYRDAALKPYLPPDELRAVMQKSVVIPNGIDAFWLSHLAPPKAQPDGMVKMLLVGQIIARKRALLAAQAVVLLNARGVPAELTVVGKPVDGKITQALKRSAHVTVLPPRPLKELLPIYRAADLFVLPSSRETFGLVYAEAISQGLPVLYTRGQGFDGQCPAGEVGFAVDASPESIADGAQAILADYERLSSACIKNAPRFDWDAIAKTYNQLYRAVVSGNQAR